MRRLLGIKIIIWDHNKRVRNDRQKILAGSPSQTGVGCGFHWYSGDHLRAQACPRAAQKPRKIMQRRFARINTRRLLLTGHTFKTTRRVHNNRTNTWLPITGRRTRAQAAIFRSVSDEKKELIYTPIYYYIAHFASLSTRRGKIATTKSPTIVYLCLKTPTAKSC